MSDLNNVLAQTVKELELVKEIYSKQLLVIEYMNMIKVNETTIFNKSVEPVPVVNDIPMHGELELFSDEYNISGVTVQKVSKETLKSVKTIKSDGDLSDDTKDFINKKTDDKDGIVEMTFSTLSNGKQTISASKDNKTVDVVVKDGIVELTENEKQFILTKIDSVKPTQKKIVKSLLKKNVFDAVAVKVLLNNINYHVKRKFTGKAPSMKDINFVSIKNKIADLIE